MTRPGVESMGIRAELQRTLSSKLDEARGFSFQKTYRDAPNPFLRIEGLGIVGLPLNPREAEVIKTHSGQVPPLGAAQESRTIVEAKKIALTSPKWAGFMDGVVAEISRVLGIDRVSGVPGRLSKVTVLLDGPGPNSLPHIDAEKDGVFATVVVVLPSEFSGGEAHLSHGGIDMVHDCGATSLNAISVMAWYTHVTHEFKPIKTGHRLSLCYNFLVPTTTSPRPAVFDRYPFLEEVFRVLHAWSNSTEPKVLEKLVYLLNHRYSSEDIRCGALEGVDKIKVPLLQQVAQQAGFSIGMATVVCTLRGPANGIFDDRYDSDADAMDFEDEENVSRKMTFKDLIDLSGDSVSSVLKVDNSTETIPKDMADVVEAREHDGQKSVESPPGSSDNDVLERFAYHGTGLKYACRRLGTDVARSSGPTQDTLKLVKFLLLQAGHSPTQVIPSVCRAAIVWKDGSLWNDALKKHFWDKSQPVLDENDLSNGIYTFGFASTKETFEHALRTSPDSQNRLQLLSIIESPLREDKNIGESSISSWLDQERENTFKTLEKPTKDNAELIVLSAFSHGGIPLLSERIVPQFIEQADSATLDRFQVGHSCAKTDFFKPKQATNLGTFRECLKHCITVQCLEVIPLIIEKAMQTSGLLPASIQDRVNQVMFPLISIFIKLRSKTPRAFSTPTINTLAQTAITLFLESMGPTGGEVTAAAAQSLVQAASIEGGLELIATRIMPCVLVPGVKFGPQLALAEAIRTNTSSLTADNGHHGPDAQSMITTLVNKVADAEVLDAPEDITSALHGCVKLNAQEAYMRITQRLVTASQQATSNVLEHVLFPVIPALRNLAHENPQLQGHIRPVFQAIFTRWVGIVLGPTPAQDPSTFVSTLPNWACTCSPCNRVKAFLKEPKLKKPSIRLGNIGQATKDHVESGITEYATSAATYAATKTKRVGLEVVLSEDYISSLKWAENQKEGLRLLRSLSTDENELRLALGVYYPTLLEALRVEMVNEASTSASSSEPSIKKRRLDSSVDVVDLT